MSMAAAMHRMVAVLRTENAALAAGDLAAAAALLPEKEAAAAALRAALPDAVVDPALAAMLRDASRENGERLSLAIEVQGRVLELVARAARACAPVLAQYGQYGRRGALRGGMAAQALTVRA